MILKIIDFVYDKVEFMLNVFFSIRGGLDRPLFFFDYRIRGFLKKYGQKGEHLYFESINKEIQIKFLKDYTDYLKFTKSLNFKAIYYDHESLNSPAIQFDNNVFLFFYNGKLRYKFGLYSSSSRVDSSFESNLH